MRLGPRCMTRAASHARHALHERGIRLPGWGDPLRTHPPNLRTRRSGLHHDWFPLSESWTRSPPMPRRATKDAIRQQPPQDRALCCPNLANYASNFPEFAHTSACLGRDLSNVGRVLSYIGRNRAKFGRLRASLARIRASFLPKRPNSTHSAILELVRAGPVAGHQRLRQDPPRSPRPCEDGRVDAPRPGAAPSAATR